jgi:hypothetical protein
MNRHERRAKHVADVKVVRAEYLAWQKQARREGRPSSPDAFMKFIREGGTPPADD